jgi:hypothetical protein
MREELADSLIVVLDVAWTQLPNEPFVKIGATTLGRSVVHPFESSHVFDAMFHIAAFGQHVSDGTYHRARSHIARALDIVSGMAMSAMPDQENWSAGDLEQQLLMEVKRKLGKWARQRAAMEIVTDDV